MKFAIKLTLLVALSTLILFGLGGCDSVLNPTQPTVTRLTYNPSTGSVRIYASLPSGRITECHLDVWIIENGQNDYQGVMRDKEMCDYIVFIADRPDLAEKKIWFKASVLTDTYKTDSQIFSYLKGVISKEAN